MYAGGGAVDPMTMKIIKDTLTPALRDLAKKPAELEKIVAKYALKIQGETKAYISDIKLVDTGALMNSIEAVKTSNPLMWLVQDGVYYGIMQERGTSRGVTAKHFLGRTVERNSDPFIAEVKQALAE